MATCSAACRSGCAAAAHHPDSGEDDSTILEVNQLSKHFGGLKAVDEVELSVGRNTVHALVGPNGSGKTTLLNVLSGIYKPTTGRLFFDGQPVTRLLPHERAGRGIGRTFQNVRLFTSMSVLENIIVGAERPGNAVAVGSNGVEQHALAALDFVGLVELRKQTVQSLSYGHQRLTRSLGPWPAAPSCYSSMNRAPA